VKTVLSKTCFQNAPKFVFLGVILQNFPRGMHPDPYRMVVPSALALKLICDVTRLLRNLALPSEIFCVRHCLRAPMPPLPPPFQRAGGQYPRNAPRSGVPGYKFPTFSYGNWKTR